MKRGLLQMAAALLCVLPLGSCKEDAGSDEMVYIKTSTMYDTLYDMYSYPEEYLGGMYHMVGELYAYEDEESGEMIYSVYCEQDGAGLGLELDWSNDAGIAVGETITVEGRLEQDSGFHHGETVEFLVLRVTMLEQRQ